MAIWLSEERLERAMRTFFREARIPRPQYWTVAWDALYCRNVLAPAFMKALEKLGPVHLSHKFDLDNLTFNDPGLLERELARRTGRRGVNSECP